jgi:hypothetical protein
MFVDARWERVQVTCYPILPVPEDRLPAVVELMNLIACTGFMPRRGWA